MEAMSAARSSGVIGADGNTPLAGAYAASGTTAET
jgi:hypothetical protein